MRGENIGKIRADGYSPQQATSQSVEVRRRSSSFFNDISSVARSSPAQSQLQLQLQTNLSISPSSQNRKVSPSGHTLVDTKQPRGPIKMGVNHQRSEQTDTRPMEYK